MSWHAAVAWLRARPMRGWPYGAALGAALIVMAGCSEELVIDSNVEGGDAERGRGALMKYQCGVCHSIPGVPGAVGRVGQPLDAFARNAYVAGKFPNTPEVLMKWIADAPAMAPATGMPAIAMSEQEARDMAAYLYTLE